jgi:hypothetical protein
MCRLTIRTSPNDTSMPKSGGSVRLSAAVASWSHIEVPAPGRTTSGVARYVNVPMAPVIESLKPHVVRTLYALRKHHAGRSKND